VDGVAAMAALFAPIAGAIRVDRYDMLDPVVQHTGDLAVFTFNLINYRTDAGAERAVSKWNSSEVYRKTPSGWRIAHSHWSFVKPELKEAVTEAG
jgi:ketosteroid isomerase-like protein